MTTQDILVAVLTPLMPFLVSGAIALFHWASSKLPANKLVLANQIVSVAVPAVEQMFKNMPGSGVQKKAEAVKLATAMLNDHGLKVSADTLNALLESAVRSLPQVAPSVQESPVTPGA